MKGFFKKIFGARRLNFFTNLALAFLIFSVGFVCLFPTKDTVVSASGDSIVRKGNSENGISLMFNVYQGTEEVYSILKTLDEFNAKATFFVGGSWADDNDKALIAILKGGHELGNHGYFHKDHSRLNKRQNQEEIATCNQYVEVVTGVKMRLFAPPSGAYSDETLAVADTLNMKTVLWSRDTIDWRDQNPDLIYTRATKNVGGGELILMHPTKATAKVLYAVLQFYKTNGFSAVTVSENLKIGG